MRDRGVHAAIGDEPDQVHPLGVGERRTQRLALRQRAIRDRVVDSHQILAHHRARAEVQMSHLAVSHLPVRQAHRAPTRRQRRVRICLPQRVENRRARQRDRVAWTRIGKPPPVEHDQASTWDRQLSRPTHPVHHPRRPCPHAHQAAAVTICANACASSDAPPTSAPSTSVSVKSSAAFSGLTDPPYRIRTASAACLSRSPTSARMNAIASCACSGVATLPVPIAHIGSYAITTSASRSLGTFARSSRTCWRSLRSVSSLSRSSSVSPTHRIGVSPAASAAGTFSASALSVSPNSARRSECPSTTPRTSSSHSIGAEISPVYAPSGSWCMFCAYTSTRDPRALSTIARRSVNGTQIATSTPSTAETRGSSAWMCSSACSCVLYIFQLPAISGVRGGWDWGGRASINKTPPPPAAPALPAARDPRRAPA